MSSELYPIEVVQLEAQMAAWAVTLCGGVLPKGLSRALEDFHRPWMGSHFWIDSPNALTNALIRHLELIPEVHAWSVRGVAPIPLNLLAQSITASVWKDFPSPAMKLWQKVWKVLLYPIYT